MIKRQCQKGAFTAAMLIASLILFATNTACAEEPAKADIEIYASEFGGVFYVVGQRFSELINKTNSWMKAGAWETHGSIDNIKRHADDQDKRAKALRGATASVVWPAKQGQAPLFDKKYDVKALFTFGVAFGVFATADPKIKTVHDLRNKRVCVGDRGSSFNAEVRFMLQDCTDVWDKIKPEWLSHVAASNAFMDGMVDVMYTPVLYLGGDRYIIHPQSAEALRLKKVYLFGITKEELEKGKKKSRWPASKIAMPAGALPERANPKEVVLSWVNTLGYVAYADMDEKVAYEIVKTAHQNIEEFKGFHGICKSMTPEVMAWLPVDSEKDVHPGALKYYREQGIKISVGGASPMD